MAISPLLVEPIKIVSPKRSIINLFLCRNKIPNVDPHCPIPFSLGFRHRKTSLLTKFGGDFPVSPPTKFSTAIVAIRSRVSREALAI